MFDSHQWLFLIIGSCALLSLLYLLCRSLFFPKQQFFPRKIISPFELKMFARLNEAFPAQHILTQVAFSALVTSDQYKIRAKFNRKVTDFVVVNPDMQVLAIIELDDPSHIGKEQQDAERDLMLTQAGYRVFRYTDIPTIRKLKQDIL